MARASASARAVSSSTPSSAAWWTGAARAGPVGDPSPYLKAAEDRPVHLVYVVLTVQAAASAQRALRVRPGLQALLARQASTHSSSPRAIPSAKEKNQSVRHENRQTRVPDEIVSDAAEHLLGQVQFLFNSAGAAIRRAKFLEIDDTLMEKTFALNVNGTLYGMQALLPHMLANRHGVIVNMASMAHRRGGPGSSIHYAAAKGAVVSMTLGVARELRRPHADLPATGSLEFNSSGHEAVAAVRSSGRSEMGHSRRFRDVPRRP